MRPTPQASPRSFARLVGLVGGFLAALAVPASAATVATDKPDYAPGQTVVITGSGWEPGETVVSAKATAPHETELPARRMREDWKAGRCS